MVAQIILCGQRIRLENIKKIINGAFSMEFKERLITLRKHLKASQRSFAEAMRISVYQYQKYEYGENLPTIDKLSNLLLTYSISADFLLGLSDDIESTSRHKCAFWCYELKMRGLEIVSVDETQSN